MRQIEIEVNGKKRPVTLEQLQTLVSRRFIKPDATAWVDDEELKVAELINRQSTGEKPNGTGTPIDQTAKPKTSEVPPLCAETIDFRKVDVPVPQSTTPKMSRKAIVVGVVGLIVVVAAIAAIAICYSGGSRKSKPTVELEVKPSIPKPEVENKSDFRPEEANFSGEEENQSKENATEENVNDKSDSSEDREKSEEPFVRGWEPFDRSWDTIPDSYDGDFFPDLYSDISKRHDEIEKQRSQGEFETSEEFRLRMERDSKNLEQGLIRGNIHFGSTIGFPLVSKKQGLQSSYINTVDTLYDPDLKSLTISIGFGGNGFEDVDHKLLLVPMYRDSTSERYAAVNGFNAQFEVSKTTNNDYGVCMEFDNPLDWMFYQTTEADEQLPSFLRNRNLRFVLSNVPLEFAKETKGRISGFCVCDLEFKEPYFHWDHSAATFSSPYERSTYQHFVFVKNIEFWFYDEITHSVVAKYGFEESFSGKPKNFADAKNITRRGNLNAVSSGTSDNAGSTNSVASPYASTPFVSDDLRIPVDYQGHDPVEVVNALSQSTFSIPSKTFSNINEYRNWLIQRAISLKGEPLYGSMTFDSQLACVMKNASEADGDEEVISTEYQESSKTMTIRRSFKFSRTDYRIETKPRGGFGGGGFGPLRYNSGADNSSESAPDVFFSLCLYRGKAYGLDIENMQVKKRSDPQFDHWTLTEVSYDDYNRLKDSIRVLCVFQLRPEGSDYSGFYESSNSALTYPSCAIATVDPEFWLYDGKTGVILAKFKTEDFFNGRRIALSKTSKEALSRPPEEAEGILGEKFSAEPEPPTWDDVLQEAVDSPESWESKKPTITIPDDAASLEEALAKSAKGDVILVRATETPVPLKGKKAARGESSEVTIDHAVAIVGESGENGSAIVELDAEETLRINSRDLVAFKGTTFSTKKSPSAKDVTPQIVVANDSKAKFKNCVFQGNGVEEASGVVVEGEFAVASFWKCQFQQFGIDGLRVQDSAKTTVEFCQFLAKNRYGLSSLSGAEVKVDRSQFDGNVTGFQAEGGGGVVVSNSFFSGNRSNWSISSGSMRSCDTKEGNVIEK